MSYPDNDLQGRTVLVTRPQSRAEGLCRMIELAGGKALRFPAIVIEAPRDTSGREQVARRIDDYDIAVFISPTAAEQTLDYLGDRTGSMKVAAIGSRTAYTLQQAGIRVDIQPDGHDSESLLAQAEFQTGVITGKHIVIFKGEGGRELLADTLAARGAIITLADMYRRRPPRDSDALERAIESCDIVTVSSNEGLQNLYTLAKHKQPLLARTLVVPGSRATELAASLGFTDVIQADNATDSACINALKSRRSKIDR